VVSGLETHVLSVLADIGRHPIRHLVRNWNWKASVCSSVCRAAIFFALNAPAGLGAATRAMMTELIFRAVASGTLGSLTQALRHSRPRLAALVILPAVGHAAEYLVHLQAGTPRLGASIAASLAFSVLTTAFNLFAMRRGALIVGPGQQSFASDLARFPALVMAFATSVRHPRRPTRRVCTLDGSECPRKHCT